MDFFKDLAHISSGSGNAASIQENVAGNMPSLIQEMGQPLMSPAGGAGGATGDIPEGGQRPAPTPEEQEQMLSFLTDLQKMQETDPAEYEKVMASLMGGAAPPGNEGDQSDQSQSQSLEGIISAVQGLRAGGANEEAEGGLDGLQMPGTKKDAKAKGQPGIKITPEPGFTFKTRSVNAGDPSKKDEPEESEGKIFINICVHEKLSAPAIKKKLNDEGEEVEGMNIPMSVGAGRKGEDKSGVKCMIYDIIVNPEVINESNDDKSGKYRDFVCQLGMQCVEQKYSVVLDRRYKLPKLKYMGDIESQLIVDRKNAPVIEELPADPETTNKAAAARVKKAKEAAKLAAEAESMIETKLKYAVEWKSDSDSQTNSSAEKLTINLSNNEYVEPVLIPDDSIIGITVRAEVESYDLDISKVSVKASPYQAQIKLPKYKPLVIYFPCTIDAVGLQCSLQRREGFTGLVDLCIVFPIDRIAWESTNDAGSKPWLVDRALTEVSGPDYNPYEPISDFENKAKGAEQSTVSDDSNILPEDRFHLRMPSNVDQYTGVARDDDDDEQLPEDRFHKTDASSQYLINQREQAVKDKWDKHKSEKAEREANPDPNVEYIDVDDFKPGGKMGPEVSKDKEDDVRKIINERDDLKKAANVVASLAPKNSSGIDGLDLSSSLWTELLD